MEQMTPIRIGTVNDKVQTQMVIDMLNQQGIYAYSESIATTSYRDSYRGYGVGGQAVYVDSKDAAAAKEIVGDFFLENSTTPKEKKRIPLQRIGAIIVLLCFAAFMIYSFIENIIA